MPGLVEISDLNFRFSMTPLPFELDGTPAIVMTEDSYLSLIKLAGGNATWTALGRSDSTYDNDTTACAGA